MSLEDPTIIGPSLGITLRPQALASQTLADPSLLRANLSRALRASNKGSSGAKSVTSKRRTASEPAKVNLRTQCYMCKGYGHLASQYSSQIKTLLVKVSIEDIEDGDVEVVVHQQDDDSDVSVEECEFNNCIRTMAVMNLTPSVDRTRLGVVRCTLAQLKQVNDWRKTVIFQTCTKIENKNCMVIVDSGSCINAIESKLVTTLGMKPVKHPNPYKITWIDATSIDVQERCQIPIQFSTYIDNVWCNTPYGCWSYHFGTTMVVRLGRDHLWTYQPVLVHP